MTIKSLFVRDLGLDLGTMNTRIFVRGKGIALQERTVIAMGRGKATPVAVGNAANDAVGRTPGNVTAIRPVQEGVLVDMAAAHTMLKELLERVQPRLRFLRPQVVMAVPSGASGTERRAFRDTVMQVGAREVFTVEEPLAAAIGAGLPVQEPTGSMVVNVGGGRTEAAVLSLGGLVVVRSIPVAGAHMDEAVAQYLKRAHGLLIGEPTSERLKIQVGLGEGVMRAHGPTLDGEALVAPTGATGTVEVRGRDMVYGLPRTLSVSAAELQAVLLGQAAAIVRLVIETMECSPPELLADVMARGIYLTGGGACMAGLDRLIAREVGLPVHVAEEPELCVVKGAGCLLEQTSMLRRYQGALRPIPRPATA